MPAKLNHPLAGELSYTEYDWWEGTMKFPELEDFRAKYNFDMDGIPEDVDDDDDDPDEHDPIELTVPVADGAHPSPAQEAALRRLFSDREALAAEVVVGLVKTFRSYMAGMMSGYEEARIVASKEGIAKLNLDSPSSMKIMVDLSSVTILSNQRDGEAYMAFDFHCAWDFEHGTSLLMHKGKFIVGSSGADFGGREDLEGHIESLLEYVVE